MSPAPHRTGVVALLGPPNAGKSTLLNRWMGEKLAIVTAKPQTTRSRILGILTREDAQILLTDTPGLHDSQRRLNRVLNELAEDVVADCDVAVLLVDPSSGGPASASGWTEVHDRTLAALRERGTPVLVVATKQDLAAARPATWPPPEAAGADATFRISAATGDGVAELLEAVVARLPEGPRLYPEDELTDRPVRFLAAELVREAAFEALHQELPYHLAVDVQDFDESDPALVRIRARILVERESQKGIVIGSGGEMIKRIGSRARREIEKLVGARVHLELRVRVDPGWLKNAKRIESLGYR